MCNQNFIRGVAEAMGVSKGEAERRWLDYSRNMRDSTREREEIGGYFAGLNAGEEILEFN